MRDNNNKQQRSNKRKTATAPIDTNTATASNNAEVNIQSNITMQQTVDTQADTAHLTHVTSMNAGDLQFITPPLHIPIDTLQSLDTVTFADGTTSPHDKMTL